jgi:translation initiation factor IF-2
VPPAPRPPRRHEPPATVRAEPDPRPVEATPPPAATGVNRRLFLDDDFLAAETARRRGSAPTARAGVSAAEPPEPGEETPAVPPVSGDADGESPAPAPGPPATASREEAPRGDEAPPGEEIAPRGEETAPRGHSAETLVDLVRGEPRDPAPDAQPVLEEPDPPRGLEAPGPAVGGADPDHRGEPGSGADAEHAPEAGGGAGPRPGPERGEPRPPGAGKAPATGEEGSEAATDPTRP